MKMKSNLTQFELALLAVTLDGECAPGERVKLAMAIWDEAGETLFPAPPPRVAVSLEQMLEKLFPVIGNGKKKQSDKEIKTARMGKYRRFLEWCEWATWGPDFMRNLPNERNEGEEEIPVTKAFVARQVQDAIKIQGRDGILDIEKVEEDFRYFCSSEKVRRDFVFGDRAKKGAAASHGNKTAPPVTAATATKRRVSPKKSVKRRNPETR